MKNRSTTFYIVRHGETEWNALKRIQGHSNIPLNKNGKIQAKELAKDLSHIKFDLAFSSDLLRAKRTSEIIALDRKLIIQTTELLREREFGKFEGKFVEELSIAALNSLNKTLRLKERHKLRLETGVEGDEEFIARIFTFLREVAIIHTGKIILVGTHGGVLRILLIHLGFATYETLGHRSISNTAYIKLTSDGIDFFVKETKGINIESVLK
ncbi:MAG TPA: histidine phosphatase family protein [Xanthomonadales bacterium]|nr:histidine phosphatase family protein [Xanthomonadales bacterium]